MFFRMRAAFQVCVSLGFEVRSFIFNLAEHTTVCEIKTYLIQKYYWNVSFKLSKATSLQAHACGNISHPVINVNLTVLKDLSNTLQLKFDMEVSRIFYVNSWFN